MSAHVFIFRSVWRLPADLSTVWNHIARVTAYPTWWPAVRRVRLTRGTELPVMIGTSAQYTVQSPLYALHYETEVVEVRTGDTVLATSVGDLVGTGRWTFHDRGTHVEAVFDWQVELTPPLLRLFSRLPFAKAVMGYFHTRVMGKGEQGLQQLLRNSAPHAAELDPASVRSE